MRGSMRLVVLGAGSGREVLDDMVQDINFAGFRFAKAINEEMLSIKSC
jgi:hypothetical protein